MDSRMKAVQQWPNQNTVTELEAFLCLVGNYKRFIKDLLRRPLSCVLC